MFKLVAKKITFSPTKSEQNLFVFFFLFAEDGENFPVNDMALSYLIKMSEK